MKTKKEIIMETERLKKLVLTCENNQLRTFLVNKIDTLLWVHNEHYD